MKRAAGHKVAWRLFSLTGEHAGLLPSCSLRGAKWGKKAERPVFRPVFREDGLKTFFSVFTWPQKRLLGVLWSLTPFLGFSEAEKGDFRPRFHGCGQKRRNSVLRKVSSSGKLDSAKASERSASRITPSASRNVCVLHNLAAHVNIRPHFFRQCRIMTGRSLDAGASSLFCRGM